MKKVLIVDDLQGWREQHYFMLKELLGDGTDFKLASSASEAYEIVYNNMEKPFDLIVTDLQMESDYNPKFAGEWLVEQIKLLNAYKKTRIVIISASYNLQLIAEGLNVHYLSKSVALKFPQSYLDVVM